MSLAGLRALMEGGAVSANAAIVEVPPGETTHYRVNEEGDLVVAVRLHNGMGCEANLGALVGARGAGVWCIPDPGTEVIVTYDDGDVEGEVYIVGTFGAPPTGLSPGKVLVIGLAIEARTANGVAVELATKADLAAHVSTYNSHTHVETSGTTNTPLPQATSPTGTRVFKAE